MFSFSIIKFNEATVTELEFSNFVEQIFKAETATANLVEFKEAGTILTVKDGIIEVDGLENAFSGELVKFESQEQGIIMNLETSLVKVVLLGEGLTLKPGQMAYREHRLSGITVSYNYFGRIIDSLGNCTDGEPLEELTEKDLSQYRILDVKAPGIIVREKVTEPVYTGIMMIDSMIPVGRGQRELIIGDRQTGKTAIALDTIVTQAKLKAAETDNIFSGLYCIYVSIGQRRSSVTLISKKIYELKAAFFTAIVAATSSDSASLQFLAPYTGCTIGEFFRDSGEHALVIYDDLSKQAVAYRQVSLLLRRPPSREAYPGDIFYLHSRLLERAAKLSLEMGGGSLTALPIIETQAGDVSAYIPTNVISITDGQIFLEGSLFYKGLRPAINIGISVSRIGAAAQVKCMRKVAGTLKLELAQFREIEVFASFGSDIDEVTRQLLNRGQRLMELLKQPQFSPITVYGQIILIYAGVKGYLDSLAVDEVLSFKEFLLNDLAEVTTLTSYDLNAELPETDIQNFIEVELKKFREIFKNN
jgi:proton translocating ATP synthase F1 alpha subunit